METRVVMVATTNNNSNNQTMEIRADTTITMETREETTIMGDTNERDNGREIANFERMWEEKIENSHKLKPKSEE